MAEKPWKDGSRGVVGASLSLTEQVFLSRHTTHDAQHRRTHTNTQNLDNGSGKCHAHEQLAQGAASSPSPPWVTTWQQDKGGLPFSSLMTGFISCSSLTELETKMNVTAIQKS